LSRILAVEANIPINDQIAEEWAKYNISVKRVSAMNKAIEWLSFDDDYLFIAINEDSVPNYLSQLQVMREITDTPIFILTSNFTLEKKIKALSCGADFYDPCDADPKYNVLGALELLKTHNRLSKRQAKPSQILTGGNIILSRPSRTVLVNNEKVMLGKKEFEILQCLMLNARCVVTHKQLLHEVWKKDANEKNTAVLWRSIDRLRRKLSHHTPVKHIKIERGVGYIFSPKTE